MAKPSIVLTQYKDITQYKDTFRTGELDIKLPRTAELKINTEQVFIEIVIKQLEMIVLT